jgi:hypothetical protein
VTFIRIHPQIMTPHQKKPDGWRLVLRQEPGENAEIAEEQVLPECVMKPDAQVVLDERDAIMLTTAEAEWLYNALGEMLGDCASMRIAIARTYVEARVGACDQVLSGPAYNAMVTAADQERASLRAVLSVLEGNYQRSGTP